MARTMQAYGRIDALLRELDADGARITFRSEVLAYVDQSGFRRATH